MTPFDLILYLVIGILSGAITRAVALEAGAIARDARRWFVVAAVVGFAGAFLGTSVARAIRLPEIFSVHVGGGPLPIGWALCGAIFFVMWCIAAEVQLSSDRPSH